MATTSDRTTDRSRRGTLATYRRRIRHGFAIAEGGDPGGLEAVLDAQVALDVLDPTTGARVDGIARCERVVALAFAAADRGDVRGLALVLRAQGLILDLYALVRTELIDDKGAT